MKKTRIEYCDSTINPVMGCWGCELFNVDLHENHCYAYEFAYRMVGRPGWPDNWREPEFFPGRLQMASRWADLRGTKRPDKPWLNDRRRIIFVNDLSDGFGPNAPSPEYWLTDFLPEMKRSPHTWLFLSKWPFRMVSYFNNHDLTTKFLLGTTITSQDYMWRLADLTRSNHTLFWLSIEPMLGPITLPSWLPWKVAWIVAGGESGRNARKTESQWARDLRDQCADMEIPFFWKQWGEWIPYDQWNPDTSNPGSMRMGKALSGKAIDGIEHTGMFRESL